MPTGIWLDPDTYRQTAGQIWGQQQIQQLAERAQAGQDWASQQIQRLQQQASAQLQSLAPPTPTPAPPPPAPPVAPAPTPTAAAITPPAPSPAPVTAAAPTAAPPAAPAPATDQGMLSPAPTSPPPAPAPTPSPPSPQDMAQAGVNWASQQIQNLLSTAPPSPTAPSQAPGLTATPLSVPGLDQTSTQGPQTGPTATPAPQTPPTPSPPQNSPSAASGGVPAGPQPKQPGDLIDQTRQAAIAAGIDPDIFSRQINQESGFNPQAGSSAGAQGIAQFMPSTAKQYGVNPWDPSSALPGAAKMMSNLLNQYGGDWSKALAAYNGGDAAVQQLNAGHPWQETQQYLSSILGGAQNVVQNVQNAAQNVIQTGQTAVNTAAQGVQSAVARTSQFAMGLSSGDAMAFCGPAAAMAFAQTYGRNPTVDEAKQLAQQVGWDPSQGMAGPQSEVKLLNAMGIDAHMTSGVDWNSVAQDASSGNPVIVDTPGHYFYVDGYNQQTGQFHLGSSATDLKAAKGQEWFTPDQIPSLGMGDPRAAIFADHPLSGPGQASSVAPALNQSAARTPSAQSPLYMGTMQPASTTNTVGGVPLLSGAGDLLGGVGSAAGAALGGLGGAAGGLLGGATDLLGGAGQAVTDKAQQTLQAVQDVGSQATQQGLDLLSQGRDILSSGNDILNQGLPQLNAQNDLLQPLRNDLAQAQDLPTFLQGLTSPAQDLTQGALQGAYNNAQEILGPMGMVNPTVGPARDVLDQAGQLLSGSGLGNWYAQQQAAGQQYGYDVGQPLDLSQPLGPQLGVDPYGQIVQKGIPNIIGGVQQGNVGDILGGALQTGLGALSAVPGTGGPEAALAGATERGLPSFLTNLLRSRIGPEGAAAAADVAGSGATPELLDAVQQAAPGASQQQLLEQITTAAQHRIAMDDLLQSINADAAQRIAADDFLRDPANYDEYGVLKGFQPPNPITYDQYGVRTDQIPPSYADLSPTQPPMPASSLLEGLQQMAQARGIEPSDILGQRLQELTDQVNASAGQPLGGLASAVPEAATEVAAAPDMAAPQVARPVADIQTDINRVRSIGYLQSQASGDASRAGNMAGPSTQAAARTRLSAAFSELSDLHDELQAARQPGMASAQFARMLGGAALGGGGTYLGTDPNDPNRWAKVGLGALAGGVAGGPGLDLALSNPAVGQFLGEELGAAGTPEEVGAARAAQAAGAGISPYDWIRGFYRGGLISAPATMADVALNSGIMPVVSLLGGYGRDALSLSPDRLVGRTLGTGQGIRELATQFLDELRPGAASAQSLIGRAAPGAEMGAAYAAEGAGRLHGAFSAASGNLTELGELGAKAGEAASQVAALGTQGWKNAFDAFMSNPPADALAAAQATGARSAATQDLTGISGRLASGAQRLGPVGDALFPIVTKGMQLANRRAEFVPGLGSLGTAVDVAKGMLGSGPYADLAQTGLRGALGIQPQGNAVGPLGERLMNNAIGTVVGFLLAKQALQGNVTGSWQGLMPEQQDVLRAQGQIPTGVKFPDGSWHDWSKLPPSVQGPLAFAGAYADAQHAYDAAANAQRAVGPQAYGVQDPRLAQAEQLILELTGQQVESSPLRQWSNVYNLATGGNASAAPLALATTLGSSVLGSLVPESAIVRTVAQATDPNQRQVLQPKVGQEVLPAILQNLEQNLPGVREQLPSRVDVLGRDVPNPAQGLGAVLPMRAAAGQPSPVLSGMASAGFAPSAAPSSIAYGTGREIKLTPDEQRQFQQIAGQRFNQMASNAVNSAGWQNLQAQAAGTDAAANRARALMQERLQPYELAARQYAENQVLRSIPADQRMARSQFTTGIRAPVYGYGPDVAQAQALQQQMLLQSLLGPSAGPSAASLEAARLAGIG